MSRIGVIVLAAGRSTRFSDGSAHKLLARLGDATVVRHAVRAAIDSAVGDVVVVTGAEAGAVASALEGLDVRVELEPAFADGMATSLRRGVETFRRSVDAVIVALGDQPGVRPDAYRRVAARWSETGAPIVISRYAGDAPVAHPTLFGASVFDELLALRGDVGARSVIARDASRVVEAALEWLAPRDVDTLDDLAVVAAEMSAGSTQQVTGESQNRTAGPNGSIGE